jgi:hypothetical protein
MLKRANPSSRHRCCISRKLGVIDVETVLVFRKRHRTIRCIDNPMWLDTVNVPVGGSVDVILDFTNPIIKRMSLFHCHLLNHEDKGMMAKILFK